MKARVVWLAVLGLLLAASPVAGAQTDASDPPNVRGPLESVTKRCGRRLERNNNGVVIGVVRSCVRFYRFRPSSETNSARDYGVIWLQTTIDTRRRWCATTVRSTIPIPRRARLHSRRPRVVRLRRLRGATTRLVVDANGHARRRSAYIRRWLVLYPRVLRGVTRNDGRAFRAVWFGSSDRELAFASGVEISWKQGNVPVSVSSRLRYEIKRKRSC
jgi:hypothetical protein